MNCVIRLDFILMEAVGVIWVVHQEVAIKPQLLMAHREEDAAQSCPL